MKVVIDDVQYVPAPEVPSGKGLLSALEVRFDSDAGDDLTVRQYLHRLLATLWDEGEGFSGKRPFGNSGWEDDLYKPLIRAGFIPGKLDEDGYVEQVDAKVAGPFVSDLIAAAFFGLESA